jgi:hypothetical protein
MEVFDKNEAYEYFNKLKKLIQEEISTISDDTIQNTDIEELKNYYFEKWNIQPISLFLDELNPELTEEKVKRYSSHYRTNDDFYYCDGYKITYNIKFDGDNRLFHVIPSTRFSQRFHVLHIEDSTEEKYGIITYAIEFTKQEIEGKDKPDFARKQFDTSFEYIKQTIANLNNDVQQYNNSIQSVIKNSLEARKKKADEFVKLSANLAIPLKTNPYAPNVKPILLKKNIVKKPEMPKVKQRETEYGISSNDYENIKKIIGMAGYSMEKTAKTFNKLTEEELRDLFIAFLNTHYLQMATGETFSKKGKTDIHIQFDNKSAYIAECKIWSGEKNLQEAINQLNSYTTWHDVKTSIIIFNKENKDFIKLLEKIKTFLDNNELCLGNTSISKNEWSCKFRKNNDDSQIVTVHIVVFDICV